MLTRANTSLPFAFLALVACGNDAGDTPAGADGSLLTTTTTSSSQAASGSTGQGGSTSTAATASATVGSGTTGTAGTTGAGGAIPIGACDALGTAGQWQNATPPDVVSHPTFT